MKLQTTRAKLRRQNFATCGYH